jgi:hypothetical protein
MYYDYVLCILGMYGYYRGGGLTLASPKPDKASKPGEHRALASPNLVGRIPGQALAW